MPVASDTPFRFAPGTRLEAGQCLLLVPNAAAFHTQFPQVDPARIAGEYAGALSNDGERITVLDNAGGLLLDLTYDDRDPWPAAADGAGGSLHLADPLHTPRELIGTSAYALVHPEDQAALRGCLQDALTHRTGAAAEYRCRHRKATWRMLESTGSWIYDEQDAPQRCALVSSDITRRKETEKILRSFPHLIREAQEVDQIEEELPEKADAYPVLKGQFAGLRKFRIGDYRVIYAVLGNEAVVLRIGHRKDVYRKEI